ncbi:MAG TPA: crosslink repair DNA glycosylase YcaQ family protein [Mobilitalea sp.]|nr:crosslink repair DNA glycosylase YcaQ family protein [Mobilitalea sp.]
MEGITLTKQQARQFILLKQGLLGDYKFNGKDGVLVFINQAGCIQFDPIDVCGKNAELVLQSRIKGFTKKMLYELLYEDRKLIDYFDKNLAIIPVENWPHFERFREANRYSGRGREEVDRIAQEIKAIIRVKGAVCSKDLEFHEKVDWYWSSTKLSRAALETLYFRGDLVIHHKKGAIKYYAMSEDYIPKELLDAKDPFPKELEHLKWRVLRRISAVGLLWNKPSDAWLCIWNLKSQERNQVFQELLKEEKISEVNIEGCRDKFYCLTEDLSLIQEVQEVALQKGRTELIAALDNMLWDRKLIKELFDFEYKWEIYTPQDQRKYGYYVLPILQGERFVGRCEVISVIKKQELLIKNIWLEKGIKPTKKLQEELDRCFRRFMKFHELKELTYSEGITW